MLSIYLEIIMFLIGALFSAMARGPFLLSLPKGEVARDGAILMIDPFWEIVSKAFLDIQMFQGHCNDFLKSQRMGESPSVNTKSQTLVFLIQWSCSQSPGCATQNQMLFGSPSNKPGLQVHHHSVLTPLAFHYLGTCVERCPCVCFTKSLHLASGLLHFWNTRSQALETHSTSHRLARAYLPAFYWWKDRYPPPILSCQIPAPELPLPTRHCWMSLSTYGVCIYLFILLPLVLRGFIKA